MNITHWGWYISLSFVAILVLLMTFGGILFLEKSNSVIKHGHVDNGHSIMENIWGTKHVDAEYEYLVDA